MRFYQTTNRKQKRKKNKLFDIAQLNVFNENNGLLVHLKVKHFQWHVADLVLVIDLKKILTPGSPTTATNPPVLLASLPRGSTKGRRIKILPSKQTLQLLILLAQLKAGISKISLIPLKI